MVIVCIIAWLCGWFVTTAAIAYSVGVSDGQESDAIAASFGLLVIWPLAAPLIVGQLLHEFQKRDNSTT